MNTKYTINEGNNFSPVKEVDLVQNRYNTLKINHLWCIDFTNTGFFWIFVVLDAATKRIIAYQLKKANKQNKCTFTAKECVCILNEAFVKETPPDIIHSDHGGQFKTGVFTKFLNNNGIQQSFVDKQIFKFGNQLIERLFRTIKGNLLQNDPSLFENSNQEYVQSLLDKTIQSYNNNVHSSLIGLTPNTMQDALALYTESQKETSLKRHLTKDAMEIEQIRAIVVQSYAGNWLEFFIEWRRDAVQEIKKEIKEQSERVMNEQRLQSDRIIDEQKKLTETLKKQINTIQTQLNEMEIRALEAEALLKAKEEQKTRRLNRTRLPSRDMAGLAEFKVAVGYINSQEKSPSYHKARDIFCLFILFTTGLRVSNLLKLQVRHVLQITEHQQFDLELIKNKRNIVQTFSIPVTALELFKELREYFNTICEERGPDEFVLVQDQKHKNKPNNVTITREYLDKRLNKILKYVSKKTHKNIKTHSFRIGLTTALIEAVGIDIASKAIGHADIRTTEMYSRRTLDVNEITKAYTLAHKHINLIYKAKEKKQLYRKKRTERNKSKNKKINKDEFRSA